MVVVAQSLPSLTGTLLPVLTGRQMVLGRRLGDAGLLGLLLQFGTKTALGTLFPAGRQLFVKFSNGRLCLGLLFFDAPSLSD